MNAQKRPLLAQKIDEVNLVEQLSVKSDDYCLTFYFSEDLRGNAIWWYKTYNQFFKPETKEPKNKFYYGLLLIENAILNEYSYIISLGKAHFYLNKIIEPDFGINVAIHIAQEDSMMMKKSRFFSGSKKQEIASYVKFQKDSYLAGESVDHLKAKPVDEELWGDKNIVFADSIQMDIDLPPKQLVEVIKNIETALDGKEIIALPKMEKENDDFIIETLDKLLTEKLLQRESSVDIEEFQVFGIEICFSFLTYDYEISYWDSNKHRKSNLQNLGSNIDITIISKYLATLPTDFNIDNVKVRFLLDEKGRFTKKLKDIIDIRINSFGKAYSLKNGEWFSFNQIFMDFLKKSLLKIPFTIEEDFEESEYLIWKERKELEIKSGKQKDKLTYPEYYFNELQNIKNGYEILDRECKRIKSLKENARDYRIEIADLYRDQTVFAVKMGDSKNIEKLIYNIEQAKDSIVLIKQGTVETDKIINQSCLWFVLRKRINNITDITSIQFLLAIQSWKTVMDEYNIKPKLNFSFYV
jgi:uncharacterized protein (TIGR04141 family)